jgi:hypothetical protein
LITNGRFPVVYLSSAVIPFPHVSPGSYTWELDTRLALGTPAGTYAFRALPSSEVLLADGTLAAPTILGEGSVTVFDDVVQGWDEGVPPLRFDAEERRVLGTVSFRVTPAEGFPGDIVPVTVQMKTEVPLNHIWYRVHWPTQKLLCEGRFEVLFANPEDGQLHTPAQPGTWCYSGDLGGTGNHAAEFWLAGYGGKLTTFPDRPLEHFKPLGEWVDVTQVLLRIPEDAEGGSVVPLLFDRFEWDRWHKPGSTLLAPPAEFSPYFVGFRACGDELWPDHPDWQYEVTYEDGTVTILGNNPPEPPPVPIDAGIRVAIGDAAGAPGEVVEVPILASSEKPLNSLWVALSYDPGIIAIDEVDARILMPGDEKPWRLVVARGVLDVSLVKCPEPPPFFCGNGTPMAVWFHETEPGTLLLELKGMSWRDGYPGEVPLEVATLRARILDGSRGPEAVIRPAVVRYLQGGLELEAASGGYLTLPDEGIFDPVLAGATDVSAGIVTVEGLGFRRGDANSDGKADISDAVATLLYLFVGGGEPACMDAADSDDSGATEITDAITLLRRLFQGGAALPEPYPDCGKDPTRDALGCAAGCAAP